MSAAGARPTRHLNASPSAYAALPASTGTASKPVPMIPSAKITKANCPAIGLRASAACDEVSISLTPWALSVAAVVSMMKSAMMLERPMPTSVSSWMRAN